MGGDGFRTVDEMGGAGQRTYDLRGGVLPLELPKLQIPIPLGQPPPVL